MDVNRISILSRTYLIGPSRLQDSLRTALALVPEPKLIITMDGDLSHDPSELPYLVGSCGEGGVVVGSRYVGGGVVEGWGLHKRVVSRVANFLAIRFAGLPMRDCTSGFRCYHSDVVRGILRREGCKGFDVQVDILFEAVQMDFKTEEVPIRFLDRRSGLSKLSFFDVWAFLDKIISLSLLRFKQ